MKDAEFIELLNLYLDHEISAPDAARLEVEVQRHPARRRIYQDYCRMQKGCRMLAEDFHREPVTVPSPKVIDFKTASRRTGKGAAYLAGALAAAAASVAIIFVVQSRQPSASTAAAPVAITTPAPQIGAAVPTVAAVMPQPVNLTMRSESRGGLQPVAGSRFLLGASATSELAEHPAGSALNAEFAWMERVQLQPIPQRLLNTELRLEGHPAGLKTEPRSYNHRQQSVDATVEMTAFRFQR
jgi:hypothetical protein